MKRKTTASASTAYSADASSSVAPTAAVSAASVSHHSSSTGALSCSSFTAVSSNRACGSSAPSGIGGRPSELCAHEVLTIILDIAFKSWYSPPPVSFSSPPSPTPSPPSASASSSALSASSTPSAQETATRKSCAINPLTASTSSSLTTATSTTTQPALSKPDDHHSLVSSSSKTSPPSASPPILSSSATSSSAGPVSSSPSFLLCAGGLLSLSVLFQSLNNFIRAFELGSSLRNVAIIAAHSTAAKQVYSRFSRNFMVEASASLYHHHPTESNVNGRQGFVYSPPSGADFSSASPSFSPASSSSPDRKSDSTIDTMLRRSLIDLLESSPEGDMGECQLAGALSIALCYINKVKKELSSAVDSRVLILDAASDGSYASQYVSLMNLAFAASKQNIIIDTCGLAQTPAVLPEHISDIANGVHLRICNIRQACPQLADSAFASSVPSTVAAEDCLTQFLLFHYLVGGNGRQVMSSVSERARPNCTVCFCHHKAIDVAMVCSCCLAVYCSDKDAASGNKERTTCDVCRAYFHREPIRTKTLANLDLQTAA